MTTAEGEADTLPISATPTFTGNGWTVRLQVRADEIGISRHTVVRERVVVRRQRIEGRARVKAELLREELRTSTSGPVDMSNEDTEDVATNPD